MKVMLDEIARKKIEADEAQQEVERRRADDDPGPTDVVIQSLKSS